MKNSKKLLLILLSLSISSCAHVVIKDSEWCADNGDSGASCFHTLSEKSRDISKEEWDHERVGQICAKPDVFADLKSALLQLCLKNKRCSFEAIEKIEAFGDRVYLTTLK